ncbi:energy-coupling factor transporter transmembrane component T [Flexivirga caeni]|uniref:Energy-coupling factor transporter transmembrane protein EcfT n=1 Tax=Flexivirga caeni TaxID=2294115 RepID=A0A3M9LZN5_9MICO|nr:energy-coupling factor transporter transmembrane component T [Flexivirga caeni]RNI18385.1 energy-coupling factor transporter transmembrane protein EcfT [Flexivirga caeni]
MKRVMAEANPLSLLTFGVAAVAGSFLVHSALSAVVIVLCYAVLAILFVPAWRRLLWRLIAVGFAAVSLWWSTWLLGGHDPATATVAGGKILVLALPGVVVAAFIEPTRFGDALAQNLRLPARFVGAFTAALTRFDQLGETWEQLQRTRRIRGFGPSRNPLARAASVAPLTFGLLVTAMRGATQLSLAMDSRGFATAHHRSWAEPSPWRRVDTAIVVVAALVTIAAPLAMR